MTTEFPISQTCIALNTMFLSISHCNYYYPGHWVHLRVAIKCRLMFCERTLVPRRDLNRKPCDPQSSDISTRPRPQPSLTCSLRYSPSHHWIRALKDVIDGVPNTWYQVLKGMHPGILGRYHSKNWGSVALWCSLEAVVLKLDADDLAPFHRDRVGIEICHVQLALEGLTWK